MARELTVGDAPPFEFCRIALLVEVTPYRAASVAQLLFDCQLVLAGGSATDDPEGAQVLAEVREAAAGAPDVLVLSQPPGSDREINALQRASTLVLQKSPREGFGLTVTEAMWKGKPVVAGAVGGIRSQVIHGVTGFLVHSPEGAAFRIRLLLTHPRLPRRMGEQGHQHVRRHFLSTRHVRDYLVLMLAVLNGCPTRIIRLPAAALEGTATRG